MTFYISLATAITNLATYIVMKYLRMLATQEDFILLTLEGMTANMTWLPYNARLRENKDDNIHMGSLEAPLGPLSSLLGLFFSVDFQFNQVTLQNMTGILLDFKNQ